jgi:hypothetical protein
MADARMAQVAEFEAETGEYTGLAESTACAGERDTRLNATAKNATNVEMTKRIVAIRRKLLANISDYLFAICGRTIENLD